MSLSDCIKCWDTPCSCGYEYRNYTKKWRASQAAVVLGISKKSEEYKILLSITPDKHPMENMK
jgi:hypothetical protein